VNARAQATRALEVLTAIGDEEAESELAAEERARAANPSLYSRYVAAEELAETARSRGWRGKHRQQIDRQAEALRAEWDAAVRGVA
jgi:hypothetical protein